MQFGHRISSAAALVVIPLRYTEAGLYRTDVTWFKRLNLASPIPWRLDFRWMIPVLAAQGSCGKPQVKGACLNYLRRAKSADEWLLEISMSLL